eukprot:6208600-Pleurochrysis_carterae.AAC.2
MGWANTMRTGPGCLSALGARSARVREHARAQLTSELCVVDIPLRDTPSPAVPAEYVKQGPM